MKKIYEAPAMAVQRFMEENIVTTSGGTGDNTFKSRMAGRTGLSEGSIGSYSSSELEYGF